MADDINRLPCVFERALLMQHAACELSCRRSIGEGEMVACGSPLARSACGTLYGLLREKSAFALGMRDMGRVLPHAAMMKLQCGGLDGLKDALMPDSHAPDVHRLVRFAVERHGSLEALPFSEIVKGVSAFRLRRRRS